MDNLGILIQAILSLKDTTASKNQIAKDLPNLERQLQSDEKARVKIIAGLDTDKSRELIKSQIGTLFNAGNAPTVKIGVDIGNAKNAIGSITNQANVSKSLQIFDSKQLEAEGRKYFTKTTDILDRVKRYYQQNGALKVDITSLETAKGQIQSFTAVVEDSNNVIKHFNYERAKIDTGGKKANYGFAQTDSLKTVDKNAGANLKTTLNFLSKIDEKIMSIQSKATKQSNPLQEGTVYYENYNNKLTETVAKIEEIKNAHTTLSTKQKNEINKMITGLDLYRKEQQKLAYPPMISSTSIDDSVKTAQASLTTLEQKWKNQGILTGEFKTQVTALKTELDKVGDTESLKKYNVSLKLAQEQAKQLYQIKRDDTTTEDKLRLEFMQKLTKSYTQLISLKNQFAKSTNADNKSVYQTEIVQTEEIIRNLTEQFQTSGLITQVYQEQINQLKHQVVLTDEINKNTAQANATKQSQQAFKNYYNDIQKTTKAVETAISSLNQLNNSTVFRNNSSNPQVTQTKQELVSLRAEYQQLLTQLQANPTSQGLETLRTKLTELDNRMKTAVNSAKAFQDQLRSDNSTDQLAKKVNVLTQQMKAYQATNTKAAKAYKQQFSDMFAILSNPNIDNQAFTTVQKQFQALKQEAIATGKAGKTMFQTIGDSIKKFSSWMSMTYAISTFTRYVRSAITELKEIDTILTEISKTSDRTAESLRELGRTSFETASKYGQTASDYLLGVQEMSRAGFGEKESEQMAELSTLAQSAGDMTAELANSYLIATNAAYQFNGSTEKLNDVLNSQNYITNRNALNMTELANATKVAGSQSAVSSVAVDEMTAAVGTMIATTQQGGETAGRAFKAILMNLQQVSATADEINDGGEDITTESLTKYEKACADLGVSLKEVKNGVVTLREPMEILEELAVSVSKEAEGSVKVANLINAIGGKHRGNQLIALLQNWETYEKMLSEFNSSDAQGSAFEEAMKTAESWQGKLNELSNTWTDFMNGFVTSDTAKGVLDFLTAFIKGADELRDTLGTIPAILTSIATVGAFKNVGGTNKTRPFLYSHNFICIENETRFKIRLSNCWDDYAKAL